MHDDLTLLKIVHEQGVVGGMQHFWLYWNTRWTALLWINCWYAQWDYLSPPIVYHLLTLLFMCGSFFRVLQSLEKKFLIRNLSFLERCTYSVICFTGLIAASYSIGDTWFWVNTSAMYGWNLGCMLYALAILLRARKNIDYLVLPLLGLYIGGAGELSAVMLIAISIVLFSGVVRIKQKIELRNILFTGAIIGGFAIAFAGNGHEIRSAALPDIGFLQMFMRGIYFTFKTICFHSPLRIVITVLLLLPLVTLANKQSSITLNWKIFLRREVLPLLLYWFVFVMIHTCIITKLMGDYGPPRAWSDISLLTMLMISWLVISASNYALILFSIKPIMMMVCIALAVLCIQQENVLSKYSTALDERMNVFVKVDRDKQRDTLFFDEIAPVYFLHSADPGFVDNAAWTGLKIPIVIKKRNE